MSMQQMLLGFGGAAADVGQDTYTTPGSYTWTCPANTEYISVFVCSGGGAGGGRAQQWSYGGGGQGGNTAWRNSLAVTAGQNYTVVVGYGGYNLNGNQVNGGDSYFNGSTTASTNVKAVGGFAGQTCNNCSAGESGYSSLGNTNAFSADSGGAGYGGIGGRGGSGSGGGGGCAGYGGNGGLGSQANYGSQVGWRDTPTGTYASRTHPTCGWEGGGGGGHHRWGSHYGNSGGAGGGIGIYGKGSNGCPHGGAGQRPGTSDYNWGYGGYGGSSGAAGGNGAYNSAGDGGNYGGGGGGSGGLPTTGGDGGKGFVRILYPGDERSWPSTRTGIE